MRNPMRIRPAVIEAFTQTLTELFIDNPEIAAGAFGWIMAIPATQMATISA